MDGMCTAGFVFFQQMYGLLKSPMKTGLSWPKTSMSSHSKVLLVHHPDREVSP